MECVSWINYRGANKITKEKFIFAVFYFTGLKIFREFLNSLWGCTGDVQVKSGVYIDSHLERCLLVQTGELYHVIGDCSIRDITVQYYRYQAIQLAMLGMYNLNTLNGSFGWPKHQTL